MGTISSLYSISDMYELRITGIKPEADSFTLPLREVTDGYGSASETLPFFQDNFVKENTKYEIKLVCKEGKRPGNGSSFVIKSEDEDVLFGSCISNNDKNTANESFLQYQKENERPTNSGTFFSCAFGFVSIELRLKPDPLSLEKESVILTTDRFAVSCEEKNKALPLLEMFQELTSVYSVPVRNWLIPSEQSLDENKGFWNTYGIKSPSSNEEGENTPIIEAYLEQWNEILDLYEEQLDFFKCRPYKKIKSYQSKTDALFARNVGRAELEWLSKNPDVFFETWVETGCRFDGKNYLPVKVMTNKHYRSYDIEENRLVIAFLEHICNFISNTKDDIDNTRQQLTEVRDEFQNFMKDDSCIIPNLELLNFELEKVQKPLLDKICQIEGRALRMLDDYCTAMPKVTKIKYSLPRRSKVFQEVKPYFYFHEQMRMWQKFAGCEAELSRFVMQTWRTSKLYEYYCLYRLLCELKIQYEPDKSYGMKCFEKVNYKPHRDYKNERYVNNVYHFVSKLSDVKTKGRKKLTLYYEPAYPNEELINAGYDAKGIDLMRLGSVGKTGRKSTVKYKNSDAHPYYSPDFYLRISREGLGSDDAAEFERIILDAKFRKHSDLWECKYNEDNKEDKSELEKCVEKYCKNTGVCNDNRDGSVDYMFLLSGRINRKKERPVISTDDEGNGIVVVAPGADRLHELLLMLGVLEEEEE